MKIWYVRGTNSKLKIKFMIHVQGYIQGYDTARLPPQSWLCSLVLSHV